MIITIKGADFSSANIGTLSTYIISKSIGSGATFDIPNFVDKNSSVNWTITLDEGYTFGTYSVTMGDETITPTVVDNVMTISIAEVTGNVRIVVATVNENTGEEDDPVVPPVEPEEPDTPEEESITWHINHATQIYNNNITKEQGADLNTSVGGFAVNVSLAGKPINVVEVIPSVSGTFSFGVWDKTNKVVTIKDTVNLDANKNLQRFVLSEPITLSAAQFLAFGFPTDTGKTKYFHSVTFGSAYNNSPYYQINKDTGAGTLLSTKCNMGINIGYKE
jgi:hypothetical protein